MRQQLVSGAIVALVAISVALAGFVVLPMGCGSSLTDGWANRTTSDSRVVVTLGVTGVVLSLVSIAGAVWMTSPSNSPRLALRALWAAAVTSTAAGVLLAYGVYAIVALSSGWGDASCGGTGSWFVGVIVLAAPASWIASLSLWVAYYSARK